MRFILFITMVFCISACGVKGDPQPPEVAPPIGRGEPDFSKAAPVKPKKKAQQDEWDKTPDFQDGNK